MWQYILNLNNSKFFIGLTMILVNLGSKYLVEELSANQAQLFNNTLIRRLILFSVIFMATKDIVISLAITAAFIILVSGLFNENSRFCVYKFNGKCYSQITEDTYKEAKKIVTNYENEESITSQGS